MPARRRHLRVTGSAVALAAAALVAGCDAHELAGSTPECERCHGGGGVAAPPRSVRGFTATTERAVGAHRQHLADGAIRRAIRCDECHVVPSRVEGHFSDGPGHATVTFGDLARARGASPSWDHDLATCSGVYCHGATLGAGGSATAPVWTTVDGTQKTCGSCHGVPPPVPHPARSDCGTCHPGFTSSGVNLATHMNGELDVVTLRCTTCHGDPARANALAQPAPPFDTAGHSAPSERGVGAHQQHLTDGEIRRAVACSECHVVPTLMNHATGTVEMTFGPLAAAKGAAPSWTPGTLRCSGVYCHGATLGAGGSATAPVWTTVDGTQKTCGSCHGYPPTSALHPQGPFALRCHACHPGTVLDDDVTIDVAGGRHLDGALEVSAECGACHGAPPDTGAHRVHANPPSASDARYGDLHVLEDVSPAGGTRYDFGCGHCHPLDPGRHLDGTVEVVLAPEAAAAGTLKARNAPGAAYDGGAGTCSGVYCHSSGQETPAYVMTPSWVGTTALGCNGCHANPPRYASGGVGAPDANSHLALVTDEFGSWESGHFGGLPGPWHGSKHGGISWTPSQDAAPITCQTCHAETVDPSSTAQGGFYWLDTKGNYDLGGSLGYACESCHTGAAGEPPRGAGKVLPLRHINGRRDVIFDPRTALPGLSWLPPAPNRPTRPYWVTNAAPGVTFPDPAIPDAVAEGTTMSLHLASARYDPVTKTCTSVACHLSQTQVTWGTPNSWDACTGCHAF